MGLIWIIVIGRTGSKLLPLPVAVTIVPFMIYKGIMLSDYLMPEALCEDEPIAFGAKKPETVIRWADEMENLNRTDAWETVSRFREQIENSCVEPEMCDMLSKAFELLSGTANEETNYRERGENCPEGWYSEAVFTAASELMGNKEGRNILQKELEKRGVPFTCGRIPGFLS